MIGAIIWNILCIWDVVDLCAVFLLVLLNTAKALNSSLSTKETICAKGEFRFSYWFRYWIMKHNLWFVNIAKIYNTNLLLLLMYPRCIRIYVKCIDISMAYFCLTIAYFKLHHIIFGWYDMIWYDMVWYDMISIQSTFGHLSRINVQHEQNQHHHHTCDCFCSSFCSLSPPL